MCTGDGQTQWAGTPFGRGSGTSWEQGNCQADPGRALQPKEPNLGSEMASREAAGADFRVRSGEGPKRWQGVGNLGGTGWAGERNANLASGFPGYDLLDGHSGSLRPTPRCPCPLPLPLFSSGVL